MGSAIRSLPSPLPLAVAGGGTAGSTASAAVTNLMGAVSRVIVRRSTAQTLTKNVTQVIIFPTEDLDTLGEYNTGTGIFTAQAAGLYLISAHVLLISTAWVVTDIIEAAIWKNGASFLYGTRMNIEASITSYESASACGIVSLAVGETLSFAVGPYHSANVDVYADGSGAFNWMQIHRMS